MTLQKLIHNQNSIVDLEENTIIVHGVNEIEHGGEYTICGLAIPDANINVEGWQAIGPSYKGSMQKCECKNCLRVISYYKRVR